MRVPATFLAACLLWAPARAGEPPSKVRGLFGFSLRSAPFKGLSPAEAARTLSGWGVNLVFVGRRNKALSAAFRALGIRQAVEVGCFHGEGHWKVHPESRPIRSDGKPLEKVRWYAGVCPSQDWLRERIIRKTAALAADPDVAGAWLDFIRYPVHWEVRKPALPDTCYCPVCLEKFRKETGVPLPPKLEGAAAARWIKKKSAAEWIAWRADNIAGFVGEVRRAVKKKRPDFILGLFLVPWGPQEYGDGAVRVAGQDARKLAEQVDVFSPMAYHSLSGRPVRWVTDVLERTAEVTGKPVWPIVLAGDGGRNVPHKELREAVRRASADPSGGVIVFPQRALASPEHRAGLPTLWTQPKR